jgi:hypothetical protein
MEAPLEKLSFIASAIKVQESEISILTAEGLLLSIHQASHFAED